MLFSLFVLRFNSSDMAVLNEGSFSCCIASRSSSFATEININFAWIDTYPPIDFQLKKNSLCFRIWSCDCQVKLAETVDPS